MNFKAPAYLDQAKTILDLIATCIEHGQEVDNLQTLLWAVHSLIEQAEDGIS